MAQIRAHTEQNPAAGTGRVAAALAKDRLGVPSVAYFVMAGVGPLTVAAGVVPEAFAVTGLTGVPAAFIAIAIVLIIFSVGYVTMARHVSNAGAFYAFIARGLGRPTGVAGALVAVVSYNLLQVGLYGMFGPTAQAFVEQHFHDNVSWWVYSLGAWAVVTFLGLVRVDLSSKVLGVLATIEIIVLIALTISGATHPAGGHLTFSSLSPSTLTKGGVGALLAVAVLGYVGFEQSPVYAEEAKHPRRTIPLATYISLCLIAVVFAAASWAMVVEYGSAKVVSTAQSQGSNMLFALGSTFLNNAGNVLFLTSLFAAALAFHNAVWRYMFSLGREGVLPAAIGRTGASGIPRLASAVQSALGLIAIVLFIAFHWDPMVDLFFYGGTTGAFGILLLITATSISVIRFFAKDAREESLWRRAIAPSIATVLLLGVVALAANNYGTLLGVGPGALAAKLLPAGFGLIALLGIGWGFVLKHRQPEVYAAIGQGANAPAAAPTGADETAARIAEPAEGVSGT